ncbi:MAG: hypothetical protein M3P30_12310 [Chloroflexota bacterium]|nr:hypothetical protein [Chloroflexota bacterium]
MTDEANPAHPNEATDRATQIIAQALAQGLMEAEVIIAADRDARAPAVAPEVLEALERFGEALTRLVDHTEQLAERVAELAVAVVTLAEQQAATPPPANAKPQLPQMEPSFAPGGEGIDVTITDVPGFQGLMELQRALVHLPQVQSAAVRRYQDDAAAIQLVLSQPMTASAIAEGITAATGKPLAVDEGRPETLRLKLRFVSGQ